MQNVRARPPELPELTACRSIAALCVVVSHLHALGFISAPSLHYFLDGGRPAVSFFFVLSGFILNHNYSISTSSGTDRIKEYALARFARLYPTILIALIIALPTVVQLYTSDSRTELLSLFALKDNYLFWLSLSALAQLLVVTGWLPFASLNQPWNGPAWSLSCEFFFYAVFPFIQPLVKALETKRLLFLCILGWLLQGLWIISAHIFLPSNRAPFIISQFPLTHLFEFLAGIVAGTISARLHPGQSPDRWRSLLLVGMVALCIAVATLSFEFLPRYYFHTPSYVILIVLLARYSGGKPLAPLRSPLLQRLGHSSYALYMLHIPILSLALIFYGRDALGWLWIAVLLSLSYFVHYLIAEPLRRALMNWGRGRVVQADRKHIFECSK